MAERIYRLAQRGGSDYSRAHALIRKDGNTVNGWHLSFPTILAEEDGELIGFLSTLPRKDAVVVGRVVAPSPFVLLRLVEAYENVLFLAGVTYYLIPIPEERQDFVDMIQRGLSIEPWAEHDKHVWFKREVMADA